MQLGGVFSHRARCSAACVVGWLFQIQIALYPRSDRIVRDKGSGTNGFNRSFDRASTGDKKEGDAAKCLGRVTEQRKFRSCES